MVAERYNSPNCFAAFCAGRLEKSYCSFHSITEHFGIGTYRSSLHSLLALLLSHFKKMLLLALHPINIEPLILRYTG
jgi:hypothetical protein